MKKRYLLALLIGLLCLLYAGSAGADIPTIPDDRILEHIEEYPDHRSNVYLCSTDSAHYYYCNACHIYLSAEQAHSGGVPSCDSRGTCKYCKHGYIEKLFHAYDGYTYNNDATCTQDGTETAKCIRYGQNGCDVTNTRRAWNTALKHDFQNYVSNNNATCTQDSTETGKCSRCDETNTRAVADTALGHAPVADSAVDPTCTQPGLT